MRRRRIVREINLDKLDEEQLIAFSTAALAITDQTNVPWEEVVRSIARFSKVGLLKVMERRSCSGRLEVGFQLMTGE